MRVIDKKIISLKSPKNNSPYPIRLLNWTAAFFIVLFISGFRIDSSSPLHFILGLRNIGWEIFFAGAAVVILILRSVLKDAVYDHKEENIKRVINEFFPRSFDPNLLDEDSLKEIVDKILISARLSGYLIGSNKKIIESLLISQILKRKYLGIVALLYRNNLIYSNQYIFIARKTDNYFSSIKKLHDLGIDVDHVYYSKEHEEFAMIIENPEEAHFAELSHLGETPWQYSNTNEILDLVDLVKKVI